MKSIPLSFEEGLFLYTQVVRVGMHAVYTQTHKPSGIVRYETVRLRPQRAHTWPNGQTTPERETYPPSTAWGCDGFTHYTLAAARAQMEDLVARTHTSTESPWKQA